MTLPTIYPTKYTTAKSFHLAPNGVGFRPQLVQESVTVPATTDNTVVIGLYPFKKGMRVAFPAYVKVGDLDSSTNVTLNVGWHYLNDSNGDGDGNDIGTLVSDPNGFLSASNVPQDGGVAALNDPAGFNFIAEGDGWVTAMVGAATTTEGAIAINALTSYQS